MPIKALVEARLNAAADKARKVRAATAKRRQAAQQICKTPEMVVARNQRILLRKISKWMRSKTTAIQQISHLTAVLKKAQRAGVFLMSAPAELITELTDGRNWSAHPELYLRDAGTFLIKKGAEDIAQRKQNLFGDCGREE